MVPRIFQGLMETPKYIKVEFWPQCIFPVLSCYVTPYSSSSPGCCMRFLICVFTLILLSSQPNLENFCPSLSPRFLEYFSNHFRPQWFPSSQFLQHGFAALVIWHLPCSNFTGDISVHALCSYLKKGLSLTYHYLPLII